MYTSMTCICLWTFGTATTNSIFLFIIARLNDVAVAGVLALRHRCQFRQCERTLSNIYSLRLISH
jgi:hypothetical protein